VQSSNNSSTGAIIIDNDLARAEAEFKELSALDLSGKLEALKKYDYKQTKFTYLLKAVTSHFLTDYDNTISQTDFNEMASVLYHYLKLINSKLPTLSFNSERPDRETRMDLAFSYFYENYKDILLTYIRLYKNSNLVFANNISELLKQLDKSFLNSPMTPLPNNLPLPNGIVESKSNSHDGTQVTVKEIESKLRATPARYNHINSSQESRLSASRKYIDPKKNPGIVIHEKVDDLSKQLQIDRVEEEIFSLKISITLLTAAIKKSREMRECDQQLVDSIPARLARLKSEISSLDETYTHITLNYIAGGKIEKSPEMPDLMAEFKNVEKLYNSLKSKFNRSSQTKRHQNPSLTFATTPSPTSESSSDFNSNSPSPVSSPENNDSRLTPPNFPELASPSRKRGRTPTVEKESSQSEMKMSNNVIIIRRFELISLSKLLNFPQFALLISEINNRRNQIKWTKHEGDDVITDTNSINLVYKYIKKKEPTLNLHPSFWTKLDSEMSNESKKQEQSQSSSSAQDQAANEGPPVKRAKIESGLAAPLQAIVPQPLPNASAPNLNEKFFNLEEEYGFYPAPSQDDVQIPVTPSLPLSSQLSQSFFHPGLKNDAPFVTPSSHSPMDVSVAANGQSATTPYQNENSHGLMFFDNILGFNQSTTLDDPFLNTDDDLLCNFRR
jgi:hypothetical protein